MKLFVNDIERDGQIVAVPKGCFYVNSYFLCFPDFVFICPAIGEERSCGDALVCPLFGYNGGFYSISVDDVKNEVCWCDIYELIMSYLYEETGTIDKELYDKRNWEARNSSLCFLSSLDVDKDKVFDFLVNIEDDLKSHDVIFTKAAINYINELKKLWQH